ncbi:hypothetical protein GQ55_1G286600 [Panicum hallii var. hallii]|uniref:Uncharacterized protein n=1 Tax=Panicum hallii var. hallii TaxID=1504633 RepID=A0A2T7F8H7_9POAL|nr:hypothetical protein GQ55_1G286600 [Panicum hallii var. hallii]
MLAMILMLYSMMVILLQILDYAYQLSKCIQILWMQPKEHIFWHLLGISLQFFKFLLSLMYNLKVGNWRYSLNYAI